jgi:hypothetical protein
MYKPPLIRYGLIVGCYLLTISFLVFIHYDHFVTRPVPQKTTIQPTFIDTTALFSLSVNSITQELITYFSDHTITLHRYVLDTAKEKSLCSITPITIECTGTYESLCRLLYKLNTFTSLACKKISLKQESCSLIKAEFKLNHYHQKMVPSS